MKKVFFISVMLCLQVMGMCAADNFTLRSGTVSRDYPTLQACINGIMASDFTIVNNTCTIEFNTDWVETTTTKNTSISKYGITVGADLRAKTNLKYVIIEGKTHSIDLNGYTGKHYEVSKTLNVVLWLPSGGLLTVQNLKINDNICFKPWGDINGGNNDAATSENTPNTNLKFQYCIITGHYTTGRVPFKTCTFDHCRTEFTADTEPEKDFENCLTWPKVCADASAGDFFITPYKLILTNNYAETRGLLNTASVNYDYSKDRHKVKIDVEAHGNTIKMPDNANSMCLIQVTDNIGDIVVYDNKIIGDYTKTTATKGDHPQCLVYNYLHSYNNAFYYDTQGVTSFMYDQNCKIQIYNNYLQCGIVPFAIGGDDNVTIFTYDQIVNGANSPGGKTLSTMYNFDNTKMSNYEVHHFVKPTAELSATHNKCHICPPCGMAIVTADHDGCVMYNDNGNVKDVNSTTTIPYTWSNVTLNGHIDWQAISSNPALVTCEIEQNREFRGMVMKKGDSRTITFNSDNGSAKNGAKKVTAASILGSNMSSTDLTNGITWTYPAGYTLTECPVFHVTPKVKLIVSSNGYTTFSSDENVSFENPDAEASKTMTGYRATEYQTAPASKLYFTSTNVLPKAEGALVHGDPGTYWLSIVEDAAVSGVTGTNGMIKGDVSVDPNNNRYVLASSSNNPLGFYHFSKSMAVPFGYAYLDVSGITDAVQQSKEGITSLVFDNIETGTNDVVNTINENGGAGITIGGMAASAGYRGIIIRNGHKYARK